MKNTYYGDMKPQNLLKFKDYSIKIGDFGTTIIFPQNVEEKDKFFPTGYTKAYCEVEFLNKI